MTATVIDRQDTVIGYAFVAILGLALLGAFAYTYLYAFDTATQPASAGAAGPDRVIEMVADDWYFEPDTIEVTEGDRVRLIIDSRQSKTGEYGHGIAIPALGIDRELPAGETTTIDFVADEPGEYTFSCNVYCGDGHSDMDGTLIVEPRDGHGHSDAVSDGHDHGTSAFGHDHSGAATPKETDIDRIAADPTDIPAPIDYNESRHHDIHLVTKEYTVELAENETYDYMTFAREGEDGQVPGPMIRVRRGDTVELTLENQLDAEHQHNIDFHAVYGPGGGAANTTVAPGEQETIEFTAEYPGAFIYHCAVPELDHHIAAGMYGSIVIEPTDGLPDVDEELYFGQNELYTTNDINETGHHGFDLQGMLDEEPTYVAINGEPFAITGDRYGPVTVEQGDRVRLFFANGGPNQVSSWHTIGNVFETLYRDGDLVSAPDRYVETAPVGPGTTSVAEIDTPVPGTIKLVDHALSRAIRKGALAEITVVGEENHSIYNPDP